MYNEAPVTYTDCQINQNYGISTTEKREQLNAVREITHPTPMFTPAYPGKVYKSRFYNFIYLLKLVKLHKLDIHNRFIDTIKVTAIKL